jgi:nucleoid-associated protein YgaU
MIRGIAIFAFFTLLTILVIVLQPGPRENFASTPSNLELFETSRNQVQVFNEPVAEPILTVPDDLAADLKAARDAQTRVEPNPEPRLQATLDTSAAVREALQDSDFYAPTAGNASQKSTSAATFAAILAEREAQAPTPTPAPVRQQAVLQPAPQPARSAALSATPDATPYLAPELRDMSWQTLNTLNSIGHVSKAPGQEGSLLNSIVRRSMGHVDGTQPTQAIPQATFTAPRIAATPAVQVAPQRTARAATPARNGAAASTYTVSSGDTLALIAIKLYGSALATDRLLADNPPLRRNPNELRIGQVLKYSMPQGNV